MLGHSIGVDGYPKITLDGIKHFAATNYERWYRMTPMSLTMDQIKNRTTLSVPEYAAAIGAGTTSVYRQIASGEVPVIRIGRKFRVPAPYAVHVLEATGRDASARQ